MLLNYRPQYSHSWGSKTYYTQLRVDPAWQRECRRDVELIARRLRKRHPTQAAHSDED